jgi:hypothetical protein
MSNPPRAHTLLNRPWWAMGQRVPGFETPRINETATRARAGMLNALSTAMILLLVFAPELDPVLYVGPFVIFDMFAAAATGLTPFSPIGLVATMMTMHLRPQWKPTPPKRFAWLLGGSLGVVCLTMRLLHVSTPWLVGVVSICFVLTWLEASLGFCVGCWMHKMFFGCEECEVPYART